ncbi:MAG TPA: hypothetical protein ENN07_01100 [candidate division Zixibacteria bacterium]|nr:hypothetical protein [candidate division Zixibacteria bacterium]
MKLTRILLVGMIALAVLLSACAKDENQDATPEETMAMPGTGTQIPTITNTKIDEFIKNYPVVFEKVNARMADLQKMQDENPAISALGTQAMEEVYGELAAIGIDMDEFNMLYQKIMYATSFIAQKARLESISDEEIDERIAQFRMLLNDPDAPQEQKMQIQQAIAELEAAKQQRTSTPSGLTEAEVGVIEARFEEIQTFLMEQVEKARQAEAQLQG